MSKTGQHPAFPLPMVAVDGRISDAEQYCPANVGITKRDWFAGQIVTNCVTATTCLRQVVALIPTCRADVRLSQKSRTCLQTRWWRKARGSNDAP